MTPIREAAGEAILPCEGEHRGRPTRHRYARAQPRPFPRADLALYYRCCGCGVERVWGALEPTSVPAAFVH